MERNYKEDQTNEVEALESIYCSDIECNWLTYLFIICKKIKYLYGISLFLVLSTGTELHKFRILISTEEYNRESDENGLACRLVFTYTEKYPDAAPLVEIEDAVNFEDNYEEKLLEHINETVS